MKEIQDVILKIGEGVQSLKSTLNTCQLENENLKEQVDHLNEQLTIKAREVLDFQSKIDTLTAQLSNESSQQPEKVLDNQMIDELVREIDECISRLKQNK